MFYRFHKNILKTNMALLKGFTPALCNKTRSKISTILLALGCENTTLLKTLIEAVYL